MDWIENLARKHGTGGWQTLDDMVQFGKAVADAEREAIISKLMELGALGDGTYLEAIRMRSNAEVSGAGTASAGLTG